jgi:hypothetical protein
MKKPMTATRKTTKKSALTTDEQQLWDNIVLSVVRLGQTSDPEKAAAIGTVAALAADQAIEARRAWK